MWHNLRVPLVSARAIKKSYGSFLALSDVSFEIENGITGILGANGAGKTTMLGMIIGLHKPDGGELRVLGHDPWSDGAKVRERLGYAPEHHTLPPEMRAADFVRHVAELHGLPKNEAVTRASDALWLVGLGEERFRAMGTMSTGQRQRVKLAQAIAHDPELILLDEPTDGLDPVQRDAMLDIIRTVASNFNINVILSSHLLEEVEQICDAVTIIGDGRTLASGPMAQLLSSDSTAVIIELDGTPDQAASLLAELAAKGVQAELNQQRLNVAGSDDEIFDVVRDTCADLGLGIARLQRSRGTLEDVFLERMR